MFSRFTHFLKLLVVVDDSLTVVFDTAGTLSLGQCSSMLKRGGGSVPVVFAPRKLIAYLLSSRRKVVSGNPTPQRMKGITEAAEQGKLIPKIGRVVPLSEAIPALIELETVGTPKGKLVIFFAPLISSPSARNGTRMARAPPGDRRGCLF